MRNRTDHAVLAGFVATMFLGSTATPARAAHTWPPAVARAVPGASGFVTIPGVAMPPDPHHVYKTVFDATRAAARPTDILPALDMAGSELNAFDVAHVPATNVQFVVVFHGEALDGILDDANYRARFKIANPNLPVIAAMKKAGTKFYVCGQNLAFANIDPATLTRDVTVASDALIVLMTLQNAGYAQLSY